MSFKFTLVFILILVMMGCSSREAEEVGCNFTSGFDSNELDEESSWRDDLIVGIIYGLFNVTLQGAHRNISPDTYTSCAKPDVAFSQIQRAISKKSVH
jgi:hypothetical protein